MRDFDMLAEVYDVNRQYLCLSPILTIGDNPRLYRHATCTCSCLWCGENVLRTCVSLHSTIR